MRQVSETSEAEPGSMLPSHPLIHYPFSGEKKEKTFVHAYSVSALGTVPSML